MCKLKVILTDHSYLEEKMSVLTVNSFFFKGTCQLENCLTSSTVCNFILVKKAFISYRVNLKAMGPLFSLRVIRGLS